MSLIFFCVLLIGCYRIVSRYKRREGRMQQDAYQHLATEFDRWATHERTESMASGHCDVTIQMLDTLPSVQWQTVVDVGCGNGWLLRELLRRGAQNAWGIDISPKMIECAQQSIEFEDREQYQVCNGEVLPFETGSIDCVLNIESLYYYPNPQAALNEWARVVKKDGRLAIMMDLYEENPATHGWIDALDVPVQLFSQPRLKSMLEEAGWTQIRFQQIQDRRPIKSEKEFVQSRYWPSYDAYVRYRLTGSLCITAVRTGL